MYEVAKTYTTAPKILISLAAIRQEPEPVSSYHTHNSSSVTSVLMSFLLILFGLQINFTPRGPPKICKTFLPVPHITVEII